MKQVLTLLLTASFLLSVQAQRLEEWVLEEVGNYKAAVPMGLGEAHLIEQGEEITYTIFFQNNGQDTAYNLRIVDTLSFYLDPSSLRVEEATHFYNLTVIEGNIFRFSFPNIKLPNRMTNEAASMGHISFQVSQKDDLPLNTVVKNKAAAYFDFRPPVVTNEVFHTITEDLTHTDWVNGKKVSVGFAPNPMADRAVVHIMGMAFQKGKLEVYSSSGVLLRSVPFTHPRFDFNADGLPAGQLFYKISLDGGAVAAGGFVVK